MADVNPTRTHCRCGHEFDGHDCYSNDGMSRTGWVIGLCWDCAKEGRQCRYEFNDMPVDLELRPWQE